MDVEAIKQRATYSCIKCVLSVAVIGTYTDISAQEFLDVQVHVHAFSIRQWVSAWKPRLTVYWWYVGSFVLSTIHVHRTDSCTLICMLWALQLVQCSVPNSMLLCFFFVHVAELLVFVSCIATCTCFACCRWTMSAAKAGILMCSD